MKDSNGRKSPRVSNILNGFVFVINHSAFVSLSCSFADIAIYGLLSFCPKQMA